MNEHAREPIDLARLARRLGEFEKALSEISSPLHYAVRPTPEKFARDKSEYLERLRSNSLDTKGHDDAPTIEAPVSAESARRDGKSTLTLQRGDTAKRNYADGEEQG